jgi:hypothetical protein
MHQGSYDVVEHDPVRHSPPVTPERMGRRDIRVIRQQGGELFPHGFHQIYWHERHGILRAS